MKQMRWTFSRFSQCLMLMTILSVVCLYPTPLRAQNVWQRIASIFGKRPGIGDARGRSRGAAVRDPDLCLPTQIPLTAIVPNRNEAILTSKDYPAFWFYVPYELTPEPKKFTLKFVLQDNTFNDLYSAVFAMPAATAPGIMSLQLMAEAAALEEDKTYNWYFLIYCDDAEQVYEPAFVQGRIQRRALPQSFSTSNSLNDPLEVQTQFQAYADSNFWYEAFDILALNVWTNSDSPILREGWNETLKAIELDNLTQESIVGRYRIFNTAE